MQENGIVLDATDGRRVIAPMNARATATMTTADLRLGWLTIPGGTSPS
jgi:hypothetical protein